jgi:hypothetical protein
VYNRGGTAVGEYMYTMCMAGGMVSALEDDGDRVGWRVMWVVDCLRGDCCQRRRKRRRTWWTVRRWAASRWVRRRCRVCAMEMIRETAPILTLPAPYSVTSPYPHPSLQNRWGHLRSGKLRFVPVASARTKATGRTRNHPDPGRSTLCNEPIFVTRRCKIGGGRLRV